MQEKSSTVRTLFTNVGMFITAKGEGRRQADLYTSMSGFTISPFTKYMPRLSRMKTTNVRSFTNKQTRL